MSPSILKGSLFCERMFVKKQINRDLIRHAAVNRDWPKIFQQLLGKKLIQNFIWVKKEKELRKIDQSYPPKQGMIDLMLNISTTKKHYQHVPCH